jgi:hypothetical protein
VGLPEGQATVCTSFLVVLFRKEVGLSFVRLISPDGVFRQAHPQ